MRGGFHVVADALDDLLATIAELDKDEVDDYPWVDAARWSPGELGDHTFPPPHDGHVAFAEDGCVLVTDPLRPWVVTEYQPPWWARE